MRQCIFAVMLFFCVSRVFAFDIVNGQKQPPTVVYCNYNEGIMGKLNTTLNLMPGKVYHVIATPGSKINIRFTDLNHRLIKEIKPKINEDFVVPKNVMISSMQVTSPAFFNQVKVEQNLSSPISFDWRYFNSWSVHGEKGKGIFRREFELITLPEYAIARLYATEGEVRLNGQSLGKTNKAYADDYYFNLLKYLQVGKNKLEIYTSDCAADTQPELTADIQFCFSDGHEKIILSDNKWEFATEKQPNDFKPVMFKIGWQGNQYARPWVNPSAIPNRILDKKAATANLKIIQSPQNRGDKLIGALELKMEDNLYLDRNRLVINFVNDKNEVIWHQWVFPKTNITRLKKNQRITLPIELETKYLSEGKYKLQLDERLSLANNNIIGNIFLNDKTFPATTVKLIYKNGAPNFVMNGELLPAAIFYSRPYFDPTKYSRYVEDDYRQMADAGYRIMTTCVELGMDVEKSAGVRIGNIWRGYNQYNFNSVDKVFQEVLSSAPNTYIMLIMHLDIPFWWKDANFNEMVVLDNGQTGKAPSYASRKWGKDTSEAIAATIRYIKSRPYGNNLIGVHFVGGYDGQWLQPLGWKYPYKMTDYSKVMKNFFGEYLRNKYQTIENLRKSWGDSSVTFKNATIPSREERFAGNFYLDPTKDRKKIDFTYALGEAVNQRIEDFSATVKSIDTNILVGSYYIPRDITYIMGQAQKPDSVKIYDNNNFNFAALPQAYRFRNIHKAGITLTGKDQSFIVNHKLRILEDDNRTFKSNPIEPRFGNQTTFGALSCMRRHSAQRLSLGMGHWYYDMYGHWFSNPAILQIFKDEMKLLKLRNEFSPLAEIEAQAITINKPGTSYHKRLNTNEDLRQVHYWRRFDSTGYPIDKAMVRDLGNPLLPKEYKLYIFDDLYALNDEDVAKIDNLKKDNNVLVFQHAIGYSNYEKLDANNISRLVGIKIADPAPGQDLSDMAWTFAESKEPLLEGIAGKSAMTGLFAKRFVVEDKAAISLGFYKSDGKIAAAVRRYPTWTAIYLPTTYPPNKLMFNIAKLAKVHVFTTDSVILRAGSRFISAYCADASAEGTIKLPSKTCVYDVFNDKTYNLVNSIPFDLKRGETLLLFVGNDQEVKYFTKAFSAK